VTSKAFAILLIVLGVGATLGGVYGQVFLAEDEGHHDDREPTFALASQVGAFDLTVSADDESVTPTLTQAGQLVTNFDELDWFAHLTPDVLGEPIEVDGPAIHRVIVAASLPNGSDFVELGATTERESGTALSGTVVVDDDVYDAGGGLTVTRQGFDFVLSQAWNGQDLFDGPAFLTLVRADDFSATHAHAELVGDNRFSFATDLPGLGDFLAALEFEQNGETVTALFRFTL